MGADGQWQQPGGFDGRRLATVMTAKGGAGWTKQNGAGRLSRTAGKKKRTERTGAIWRTLWSPMARQCTAMGCGASPALLRGGGLLAASWRTKKQAEREGAKQRGSEVEGGRGVQAVAGGSPWSTVERRCGRRAGAAAGGGEWASDWPWQQEGETGEEGKTEREGGRQMQCRESTGGLGLDLFLGFIT